MTYLLFIDHSKMQGELHIQTSKCTGTSLTLRHSISTLAQPRFILRCPAEETPLSDCSSLAHLGRDVSSITSKDNSLSVSHPLANRQAACAQLDVQTQAEWRAMDARHVDRARNAQYPQLLCWPCQ